RDFFAGGEDRFGDFFRRGSAVGGVVLDAEIPVRPARIMAGGQDDTAISRIFSNHAGSSGGGKYAALTDQYMPETIGGRHLENDLNRYPIVITTVTAQHQRCTRRGSDGVEDGLHEIFQIVRLLKGRNALAQPGSAGVLIGERDGCNSMDLHFQSS